MSTFFGYLLTILLFLTSLFLILLVLVQRGKGGGLVGALGGMGGQSAFGAKAGGIFWATSIAAGFWILLCVAAVKYNSSGQNVFAGASGANAAKLDDAPNSVEAEPGATTGGAEKTPTGGDAAGGIAPPVTGDATKGEVSTPADFPAEGAPADAKKE